MDLKPVYVSNKTSKAYEPREENNRLNLGPKNISSRRWISEKTRIQENLERNKFLFSEAVDDKGKKYVPRERNHEKEIQPMMKFTAKNTIEKVADSLMDSLMISSTTYMPPPSKDQSKHRHHQSGVLTSLFSQLGNAKTERDWVSNERLRLTERVQWLCCPKLLATLQ